LNYFFVFQNKSYDRERSGQYLWAPKKTSSNRKVSSWELMKEVRKGDLIIHSFKKQIIAFSIAKTDVYSSTQPDELKQEGLWENDGWRVDTDYFEISMPIITSDFMDDIRRLQPNTNAPFNILGRGNTGYLFSANREMVTFLLKKSEENQPSIQEKEVIKNFRFSLTLVELGEEVAKDDDELIQAINKRTINSISTPKYIGKPQDKLNLIQNDKGRITYPRNPEVSANALKLAGYKCEIDSSHITFFRKKDGLPYTEPHHLIPLSKFNKFDYSLDIEENIISLCSHCHNFLHYGENVEEALEVLYSKRKAMLESVGLEVSLKELLGFYNLN
jgi:hypothetical protein